jgi:hypothetical protein
MLEFIINYAVLMAYAFFTIDVIMQIFRIKSRKSSKDVSIKGIFIRILASATMLIKFFNITDVFLIIGQGTLVLALMIYLIMLVYYRK